MGGLRVQRQIQRGELPPQPRKFGNRVGDAQRRNGQIRRMHAAGADWRYISAYFDLDIEVVKTILHGSATT